MADLVVAGAGMAGLTAAAEARRLGAEPVVLEKLSRPGGSMRLSSGVVWRHRELDRFHEDCPEGDEALERVRERSVAEMIDAAEEAGAPVRRDEEHVTVETVAGVTTTLGGLAVDEHALAAPGVFACGADAGGIATGGYASGLAAALVFGRIAARAALGETP